MKGYERINSFERKFHPAITIISFCIPAIFINSLSIFLSSWLLFYYEVAIVLSLFIIAVTYIGTEIINFLIQPLLGYLSDRNYRFTNKLGRRFLWIIISGTLTPIFFILVFLPQLMLWGDLGLYLYLILVIYNIVRSLYSLNYSASLISKFRHPKERLIISTIIEFFSVVSIIVVSILPGLIIAISEPITYTIVAIVLGITFIIALLFGIPGLLEERGLIETYYSSELKPQEPFFLDFFKRFKIFGQKNFLLILLQLTALALFSYFVVNRLFFYVEFILGAPAFFSSILISIYTSMMVIGIPFGFLISWFAGHVKAWIISGFILGASAINFLYLNDMVFTIIVLAAIGFASGIGAVVLVPISGDVFDENAHRQRKRSEGFNYGILASFGSLYLLFGPLITAIVQSITGFNFMSPTPLSLLGIRIEMSIIPAVIVISSTIVFMLLYDLKPDKTQIIQEELKTLKI